MVNWKEKTLGEVTSFITKGIPPKYSDYESESTIWVLNQKCNRNFEISYADARLHDYNLKKVPDNKMLMNGDVLINSTGTGTAGRVAQLQNIKKPTTIDGHMILLRPTDDIDSLYYGYAIKSCQSQIEGLAEGSTGQTELNRKRLQDEVIIRYPVDRQEQKAIAYLLSDLDEKIKINVKINNNLEQQMQALYKSWFIDFKPFGNTMPCNWKTGKLKEVLKLKRQSLKAGDNTELPYLPIDVIPMRTFALTVFKPNSEAQSSLITFDKDDIIIGAMRVYFHRVVLAPCDGITRTTCFTLAPHHKEYLSFALLCCDQDSSIDYAQSTSKGSTMPYAIWEGGLGDMEIAIPTLEIAQEFNEIVLPMLRQIQNSYFENNRLREMRDGLLPRLMSGELDVSDIEI